MTQQIIDPAAHGWTRRDGDGFSALVGPTWRRVEDDVSRFGFIAEERHLNGNGIVHGGMLMTFIDQSIGNVVWHAVDRAPIATIQLNVHFVDAGQLGDFIVAEAEIIRRTRTVIFTRGRLVAGDRLILTADGIWKALRPAPDRKPPNWA